MKMPGARPDRTRESSPPARVKGGVHPRASHPRTRGTRGAPPGLAKAAVHMRREWATPAPREARRPSAWLFFACPRCRARRGNLAHGRAPRPATCPPRPRRGDPPRPRKGDTRGHRTGASGPRSSLRLRASGDRRIPDFQRRQDALRHLRTGHDSEALFLGLRAKSGKARADRSSPKATFHVSASCARPSATASASRSALLE